MPQSTELRMTLQCRLFEDENICVTIPATETLRIILPVDGIACNEAGVAACIVDSVAGEDVEISAKSLGIAMNRVPVENINYVGPAVGQVSLKMPAARAGEKSEVVFRMQLAVTSSVRWELHIGDVIELYLSDFAREYDSSRVNHAHDIVSSNPVGAVESASWSSSLQQLSSTVQHNVAGNEITISIPADYGLLLPSQGISSDDAYRYSYENFRETKLLIGKTEFPDVQLVAAVTNPLMRFGPILQAREIVEIKLWATFSCPLVPGTSIKWKLPGFLGASVPRIFTTSIPSGALPEAAWLSDDGSGFGILSVYIGPARIAALERLQITVQISAGIRLPPGGTPSCTKGNECDITIEYTSPNTGSLLSTIFTGSDLIGVATTATMNLAPQRVGVDNDMTFLFALSFDIRAGDKLEISLLKFASSQTVTNVEPGGLCPLANGATGGTKCFSEMQIIAREGKVTLYATLQTTVVRGDVITLMVLSSAGIRLPSYGLPRTLSSFGPVGIDLISFAFMRDFSGLVLPGSGLRDDHPPSPSPAAAVCGLFATTLSCSGAASARSRRWLNNLFHSVYETHDG